jgi:hypothetical protein
MVIPYLYFVLISIMPGRIFSTLSFCFCPVVCSSGELKKIFATLLRSPLPAYSGILVSDGNQRSYRRNSTASVRAVRAF